MDECTQLYMVVSRCSRCSGEPVRGETKQAATRRTRSSQLGVNTVDLMINIHHLALTALSSPRRPATASNLAILLVSSVSPVPVIMPTHLDFDDQIRAFGHVHPLAICSNPTRTMAVSDTNI